MKKKSVRVSDSFLVIAQKIANDGCPIARDIIEISTDGDTSDKLCQDYADYISVSNDSGFMVSYVTPDREKSILDIGDNIWESKRRFKIRPSRIIRKLFNEEYIMNHYRDSDFERFNNLYLAHNNLQNNVNLFEIVAGKDIATYYHQNTYLDKGRHTLKNSCMKHAHCQDWFDIYTTNSQVSMLILRDKDSLDFIIGRALLWSDIVIDEDTSSWSIVPKIFMDRVYANSDSIEEEFIAYAKNNNWLIKSSQCHSSERRFYSPHNGYSDEVNATIEVSLTNADFDHYPFCDTLYHLSPDCRKIANDSIYSYSFELRSTEGGGRGVLCYHSDTYIDEDDAVYCENIREFVHIDYASDEVYNHRGCWHYVEDDEIVYSDYHGSYMFREDCVYLDSIQEYILIEEALQDVNGDWILKCEAQETIDGDWVHESDDNYVTQEDTGLAILREEAIEFEGCYYYINDCREIQGVLIPEFAIVTCCVDGEEKSVIDCEDLGNNVYCSKRYLTDHNSIRIIKYSTLESITDNVYYPVCSHIPFKSSITDGMYSINKRYDSLRVEVAKEIQEIERQLAEAKRNLDCLEQNRNKSIGRFQTKAREIVNKRNIRLINQAKAYRDGKI